MGKGAKYRIFYSLIFSCLVFIGLFIIFVRADQFVTPKLEVFPLSPTSVVLSWSIENGSSGAINSTKIYRDGIEIATRPASIPYYIDTGLTQDTLYTYKVANLNNSDGVSDNSSSVNVTTFHNYSMPNNLKAHWNFDEGNGVIVRDISGNGFNGTIYRDASWTDTGMQSNGIVFDGIGDSVGISGDPFEYSGGNMSISLWFYANSSETDEGDIISKIYTTGGDYNYKIIRDEGNLVKVRLWESSYTGFVTSNPLILDDWNHIALTLSSSREIKLYLNGNLEVNTYYTESNWTPPANENVSLSIGCVYPDAGGWSSTYCVQGKIDNVRIYDSTLSIEDITHIYDIEGIFESQGIAFVTSPLDGEIISGSVNLSAEVVGEVQSVQFILDDHSIGSLLTSSPYQILWNSSTVLNGAHEIKVNSTTANGSVLSSSLRIFVSNGDGVAVQIVDAISPDKILPDMTSLPGIPSNELSVSLAEGEFEPLSFVVRSQNDDLVNITLGKSNLYNGTNNISSDMIDIKAVKVWYQSGSTPWSSVEQYGGKVPNPVPELLLNDDGLVFMNTTDETNEIRFPDNSYRKIANLSNSSSVSYNSTEFPIVDADVLQPIALLPANKTKQFWITIYIPENTSAGTYFGTINISVNGILTRTLNLSVVVYNFSLIDTPIEQSIFSYVSITENFPEGVGTSCSGKNETQFIAEMNDMKKHGVNNPTFAQTEYLPLLEREFQIRQELGMSGVPVYAFTGPNLDSLPTAEELTTRITNLQNLSNIYGFTDVYAYAIDEANAVGGEPLMISEFSHFNLSHTLGAKNFVAGYGPQYTSYTNYTFFDGRNQTTYQWLLEFIDASVDAGRKNSSYASDWHQNGKKIFSYGDPQSGAENPQLYRRNFGVVIWAAEYNGTMDFIYQGCFGKPWDDFDSDVYRDIMFTYPTTNKPIDTIAWEGYREAIDDLRYISTLEATIAQGNASGNPTKQVIASQAQGYLDDLKSSVLSQIGNGFSTADFTIDLYDMRETIVNYILSIGAVTANGSCGITNNQCTTGVLEDITDSSTEYLWNCLGINGGENESCSLSIPVSGNSGRGGGGGAGAAVVKNSSLNQSNITVISNSSQSNNINKDTNNGEETQNTTSNQTEKKTTFKNINPANSIVLRTIGIIIISLVVLSIIFFIIKELKTVSLAKKVVKLSSHDNPETS